ncbi:hypothetical protein SVIOM342S_09910 [Streptomyces violaceorubidus]
MVAWPWEWSTRTVSARPPSAGPAAHIVGRPANSASMVPRRPDTASSRSRRGSPGGSTPAPRRIGSPAS